MASLDIFNSNAFSLFELTDAINNLKFTPNRLRSMGIFQPSYPSVLQVGIEQKNNILTLIAPTPRGGAGTAFDKGKRSLLNVTIPHFEINDAIYADEIQSVRAFGSESELQTMVNKVAERLGDHTQSLDATEEYSRIGAVKGIVTYADGTTLSLFTTFGVSQLAEIDFDLDNASPASGALRKACANVTRIIAKELDGIPFTGMRGLCSDTFFDDLIAHPEVRETYKNMPDAAWLRTGYIDPNSPNSGVFSMFEFGGIIWENYRGKVGSTDYIAADKAHVFPTGAPGLFRSYYGPADYIETVNTPGKERYTKQYEMENGKGISLDTQTNCLHICTRPRTLQQLKRT